jgi:hypothetical protein
LSSATAVAETPARIHKIFGNQTVYNDLGGFYANLWVRGEQIRINFDDRIPVIEYGPGYDTYY